MKKTSKPERKKRDRERQGSNWLGSLLRSPLKAALVLFVIAFLLYANTLGHDFVWDDFDLIEGNPNIGKLDADELGRMFFSNFWQGYQHAGYYRPLVTLSYHVQYNVFNGNPSGFHFANVMWNALLCVVIFWFVYLIFDKAALAAVTALLFTLHPLHTENVAWISGRTDVLSTLWAMVSLSLYVCFRQKGNAFALLGALVAFLLALFAKESAAFLPLIVVLLELPPLRALTTRGAGDGGPRWAAPVGVLGSFAILAWYAVLRAQALDTTLSSYRGYADGALGLVALPLSVLAGYAGKLLFPFRLNAEWDAPVPESFAGLHVIVGLVILVAVVVAAFRYRRRPEVVLGAGLFLFGVAPVLNIIPIGEISAERFLFFPSLGFALVLGAVFAPSLSARAAGRPTGRDLTWVLVLLVVAYGARTVTRNPVWADEKTLFTATVAAAPDSPRAHVNLGDVAMREGRLADTIVLYKKALEIDPDYTLALSNLAGVYVQQRQLDAAAPLIERAVRVEPDNAGLLANLGSLYLEQGRSDEALSVLERAVALVPDQPTAHFNLGIIKFQRRQVAAARGHFEKVAGLGPAYNMANYYLAVIENGARNTDRARQYAQRFLQAHGRSDQYARQARAILQGKPAE